MKRATSEYGFKILKTTNSIIGIFCIYLFCFSSCKTDKKDEGFTLRIRLKEDVDCLHPILSRSNSSTQIEPLIMLPMIEFSMDKIELTSLLLINLPIVTSTNDSVSVFECDIRPEAIWDNGSQITAADYAFTVKAALNPFIKNPSWRGFLKNIKKIETDITKPKHLSIHVVKNYLLSKEICGNINLYQENYYDPNKIMNAFDIGDLVSKDSAAWTIEERSRLQQFAVEFEHSEMCKHKITGSGPYRLLSWDAGAKIVLEKKTNWWGSKLAKTNPLLAAHPDRIEYLIMPDESAAILALKDGSIDVATEISPKQFDDLQKDKENKSNLQFFTPTIFQYTFLELNTRHPALAERSVRKALARLIDISGFIKNVMQGLADPIVGPIHPSRSYYNKTLSLIPFSPEVAAMELQTSGWKDNNKDGILDKTIDGKLISLSFVLLVATESGKKLALLFQEEAKKLGIEIKPETKDWSLINKDLNELRFDIAAITVGQSPSLYDPYQSWHSSNSKAGGFNRSGFATPATDSLIQLIRTSASESERNTAYLKFQDILYEAQPQIFLFSPKQRIIASTRISIETSSRRPGYAENMITLSNKKNGVLN